MIGQLTGKFLEKQLPFVILDVNGVGYEVQVPMTTVYRLPEPGASLTLYTHLAVREDAQDLFGFHEKSDRDLFRILIKVNGIGAKTAVTILSSMDAITLRHCVTTEDIGMLTSIPGIGKKSAERMVVELKDKLTNWQPGGADASEAHQLVALAESESTPSACDEAVSALQALGYRPQDAKKALKGADLTASVEDLIKTALGNMLKKSG